MFVPLEHHFSHLLRKGLGNFLAIPSKPTVGCAGGAEKKFIFSLLFVIWVVQVLFSTTHHYSFIHPKLSVLHADFRGPTMHRSRTSPFIEYGPDFGGRPTIIGMRSPLVSRPTLPNPPAYQSLQGRLAQGLPLLKDGWFDLVFKRVGLEPMGTCQVGGVNGPGTSAVTLGRLITIYQLENGSLSYWSAHFSFLLTSRSSKSPLIYLSILIPPIPYRCTGKGGKLCWVEMSCRRCPVLCGEARLWFLARW